MNNEFFQNMNMDTSVMGNYNNITNDMDVDVNMVNYNQPANNPISEGVQEKCIHRTFVHEVPHVCPIHTRIINHHVFKHTYQPSYSCCEENVCSEIQCGSCCNFR